MTRRQERAGRTSAVTMVAVVYLMATPALVLGIYAPLLLGEADLFHYLNEAICLWMALFLAPFAIIDRALAGWQSIRASVSEDSN